MGKIIVVKGEKISKDSNLVIVKCPYCGGVHRHRLLETSYGIKVADCEGGHQYKIEL